MKHRSEATTKNTIQWGILSTFEQNTPTFIFTLTSNTIKTKESLCDMLDVDEMERKTNPHQNGSMMFSTKTIIISDNDLIT